MDRKSSKTPLLEPPGAAGDVEQTASAAHNALQSTLYKSTSLKKKNSWLNISGNIRKGVMAVKGALDYVRGDSISTEGPK